jgi:Txe/YoeB family toxin of Txe-Axe toxin-antitoxin module
LSAVSIIEDYKVEELLYRSFHLRRLHGAARQGTDLNWRQLAQYAVSHVVNDFYTLPLACRTVSRVESLVDARWSNRTYKFESVQHYWTLKRKVADNLSRHLVHENRFQYPIMLFEQWKTRIHQLNADMSIIFQVVLGVPGASPSSFAIQKFIVEDNKPIIDSFFHMASLFCLNAFARLPEYMEVISAVSGKNYVHYPSEKKIGQSLDYMRLIRDYMTEAADEFGYGTDSARESWCCRH